MNFSSVYFKIRGESDQISNMDLVALYFPLQLLGSQKFAHSSKLWRKLADENGATSLCESFSRLQSKPPQSPVPCRHMADEHRRALLPARTPACCVSSHWILLQLEPKPLSPPRVHASCE